MSEPTPSTAVRTGPRLWASRLIAGYRTVALLVFNTVVLVVLLNFALSVVLAVRDRQNPSPGPGPLSVYSRADLALAYPHMQQEEWTALLRETWTRPFAFEPFSHFKEAPSTGRYVNIAEPGFRENGRPAPWPPDPDAFTVFFFGGSTTFGYGVADGETIPAALEALLAQQPCVGRLHVYNFGRGYHYSSMEMVLFSRLLAAGRVPDLAVFLDGINESRWGVDEPRWTDELQTYFRDRARTTGVRVDIRPELPIMRAARRLRRGLDSALGREVVDEPVAPTGPPRAAAEGNLDEMASADVERYFRNIAMTRALAALHGSETLFAWQPSPGYGYDLDHHLFRPEQWRLDMAVKIYGEVERRIRSSERERASLLWLGDLQNGRSEPLYVDEWHYTAAFAREIAGRIHQAVAERGLLCRDGSSTGNVGG